MRHPFDHFDVQCSLRIPERESPSGALFIRGMLIGSRIEEAWRGIGAAAQIVLETRLLLGDRAVVGAGLRQYLIAGAESGSGLEASSHLTDPVRPT